MNTPETKPKWFERWPGSERAAEAIESLQRYQQKPDITATRAHRIRRDFFHDFPEGMSLVDLDSIPDAVICTFRACVRQGTPFGDIDRKELLDFLMEKAK